MGDYVIMMSQMPQEVGSALGQGLGLAEDKQGQGLQARNGRFRQESYAEASWVRLDLLLTMLMDSSRHL